MDVSSVRFNSRQDAFLSPDGPDHSLMILNSSNILNFIERQATMNPLPLSRSLSAVRFTGNGRGKHIKHEKERRKVLLDQRSRRFIPSERDEQAALCSR